MSILYANGGTISVVEKESQPRFHESKREGSNTHGILGIRPLKG